MSRRVLNRLHPSRHGWWTTAQLAELFGTCRQTTWRRLKSDKSELPYRMTPGGKRRLVQHDVLMRFLRADPQYAALIAIADPDAATPAAP